jgi:membrane protease YdiL (CAAX protease family)
MQALAPKPSIKNRPAPVVAQTAQLSLRAVTVLEVASVLASVFLTVWVIIPLQPRQRWLAAVPALLALALMINSHRVREEGPGEIGFGLRHFGPALRWVGPPTLLACAVFAAVGYLTGSLHLTTHFWTSVLVVPVWGFVQQYALQGFIYRRMRSVFVDETSSPAEQRQQVKLAILATAAIFALAHAPNVMLMFLTLLGALLWSWVYERAPNLWALGLSHAAISLMLMTSLPSWLLPSLSVGYKHFLYQKF